MEFDFHEGPRPELPRGCEPPSPTACLGLYLATWASPRPRGRPFRSRECVLDALARGVLRLDETIAVQGVVDTVGRYLVQQCVPPGYRSGGDAPWDRGWIVEVLSRITRGLHVELAARCAVVLEQLGRYVAERSGFSLGIDDFAPGFDVGDLLAAAWREVEGCEDAYAQGRITDGERYERVIEAWRSATASVWAHARGHAPLRDPLAAHQASVLDGHPPEVIRAMAGAMIGLRGEVYERPMLGTQATGFDAHEYFLACMTARGHRVQIARRACEAAPLIERVHAALDDVAIVAVDCGARTGVELRARVEGGTRFGSLGARADGRVVVAAVVSPDGAVIAPAGALVTPAIADRIDAAGISAVVVRDVVTCACDEGAALGARTWRESCDRGDRAPRVPRRAVMALARRGVGSASSTPIQWNDGVVVVQRNSEPVVLTGLF